jgi:competence protein ComEA
MKGKTVRSSVLVLLAALWAAAAVAETASDPAGGHKVNINQASAAQLAFLPRVGAKAAARIVEYRKAHGPFSQPEQLMEVKGVGEKLYGQLKPYLTLSGPTTLAAKVSSRGSRGGPTGKKNASRTVPQGTGR